MTPVAGVRCVVRGKDAGSPNSRRYWGDRGRSIAPRSAALRHGRSLCDELGVERAHVVGHDWGAGVAWVLAMMAPERVDRLVVLSVGHANVFRGQTIEQREKSWYMLFFQFEGVAEELLPRDDWKLLREF